MVYKSIVCGVTGSSHAQKAALEAAKIARENNASLTFVYAVDVSFLHGGAISKLASVTDSLGRLGDQILNIAEELAKSEGVTPKKVLRRGPVLEVLKQVIQEEKADVLFIGHEKRTFLEKMLVKGEVEDHAGELAQQTGVKVQVIS